MRILSLSNYFPEHVGGIEFVALNLVSRWRKNHQVRWMACDVKTHLHRCEPDDIPLPAWNFTEQQLGFPYPVPLGSSLFRVFAQVRWCQVVHLNDCLYLANWIAFLAALFYRKPVLVTQHAGLASYPEAGKRFLQRMAYYTIGRLVLGRADRTIFISSRVKNWFESWLDFRRPPAYLPNGVDHRLFFLPDAAERRARRLRLGFPAEDPLLLFVGRFMQNKGIGFVEALARARTDWRWLMIGSGEIDPHRWSLPNVTVIPPCPHSELRSYYIAADLFVLPSLGEGFPLTVQEALACGLPVAVALETADQFPDAPLIRLDVAHLSSVLQSLDDLFASPQNLDQIGITSAGYARRWDWYEVASEYESMFASLV